MQKKRLDLSLIGHFAIDTIIIREPYSKTHSLGGGVTYGSLAACHFDRSAEVGVVSYVSHDFEKAFFGIFKDFAIDISGVKYSGRHTTQYQLDYHDNTRDLCLLSKARDFEIQDVPESFLQAKAIHLTPIADEFPYTFLKALAKHPNTKDSIFGIDVQGVIRAFDDDGNILMKHDATTNEEIFKMLRHFGKRMIFKASDKEAVAVTDEEDLRTATEKLGETGAYICTTMGPKGLYFKSPGKPIVYLPAYQPVKCVDETGAGDCFMATLLLQLGKIEENIPDDIFIEALKVASAASSYLIEDKGPKGYQTQEIIKQRVRSKNTIQIQED